MWQLFWSFFKIGAFTFGGGYAMIPLIQNEVVGKKGWITEAEFIDLLAIAQSFPGPLALNTAILIGNRTRKIWGGVVATAAIALPSFVIILLIAMVFSQYQHNPYVEKIFMGLRPAVVGLIAAPLYRMGKGAGVTWKYVWIPVAVAVVIWQLGVSPIYIVLAAVLAGILIRGGIFRKKAD
ncbi:MAG: chromate transporter [Marinifilaceae bacterium]